MRAVSHREISLNCAAPIYTGSECRCMGVIYNLRAKMERLYLELMHHPVLCTFDWNKSFIHRVSGESYQPVCRRSSASLECATRVTEREK